MTEYRDKSLFIATPTRGAIDGRVYANHLSMALPPNLGTVARSVTMGKEVGSAYNALTEAALESGCTFILTLEDDMIVPRQVVGLLMGKLLEHDELAALSALYYTKGSDSFPLVLGDPANGDPADFEPQEPTAGLVEVNAIPMGCALWRMDLFRAMPSPWFVTTMEETQDIFFCRHARAAGHRFAVDCSLRVGHLDVKSGKEF